MEEDLKLQDDRWLLKPAPADKLTTTTARQGPRCKEFASGEAILGLVHASNTLASLRILTLEDSPVTVSDISTFCDALLGFSGTLTELSIDVWKGKDTSVMPSAEYTAIVREQVLESISKMMMLKKLRVRDWGNLVRNQEEARVLTDLAHLEEVYVRQIPNSSGTGGDSMASDIGLPFKVIA